jgi:hypothetical protein
VEARVQRRAAHLGKIQPILSLDGLLKVLALDKHRLIGSYGVVVDIHPPRDMNIAI